MDKRKAASRTVDYRPVKTEKASDLIVRELWELILRGELKPGDKLPPERELVKKFRVSNVPLREALQTLQAYGHIVKKRGARGGSIVLDVAPTKGVNLLAQFLHLNHCSSKELIQARLLVEPLIAREAARSITPKLAAKLRENLRQHELDFRARGASHCGWEFYLILAEASGNRILSVFEELLIRLLLDAEFAASISDLQSSPEQLPYNRAVLRGQSKIAEAVLRKDPDAAEGEMRKFRRKWAVLFHSLTRKTAATGRPVAGTT